MRTAKLVGIVFMILIVITLLSTEQELSLLHPLNNSYVDDRMPVFRWKGSADFIMIDDMADFSSPIIARVRWNYYKPEQPLELKKYYWKLVGKQESDIFEFEVDGLVALQMKEADEGYNITNSGSARVLVEQKERISGFWSITGLLVLRQKESALFRTKNEVRVTGKQNE